MASLSSSIHMQNMGELVEFAMEKNPLWPFAAAIVSQKGELLCQATDCAHISPLYHAETLAIHALATHGVRNLQGLTLYCTTEPDHLSLSALYWAQITHELSFDTIVFGSTAKKIQELWPFDLNIPLESSQQVLQVLKTRVVGQVMERECDELFERAKEKQIELGIPHPGRLLSKEVSDFFQLSSPQT